MFAVVLVLFGYLAWFYSIRYVCNSIIRKLVNKSYEKKLRKGTTFREWFGFKKFRLEIPHIHISLIYITLWLYIALMIIFVVLYFTQAFSEKTLNTASMFVLIASWISAAIYESFFWGFIGTGLDFIILTNAVSEESIKSNIWKLVVRCGRK